MIRRATRRMTWAGAMLAGAVALLVALVVLNVVVDVAALRT